MTIQFEPEYADGGYKSTNANDHWYAWARENITPEIPDKNFEIVYVACRDYDDGYQQMTFCIRLTNPNVVQEKNKPLPASALVTTQLLFIKLYKTDWDDEECE